MLLFAHGGSDSVTDRTRLVGFAVMQLEERLPFHSLIHIEESNRFRRLRQAPADAGAMHTIADVTDDVRYVPGTVL